MASRVPASLVAALFAQLLFQGSSAQAETVEMSHPPSIAFYYGDFAGPTAPWELADAYAALVVEPGHGLSPKRLRERGTQPIAYLSVGEVSKDSPDWTELSAWVLGENAAWNSAVLDVGAQGYVDHLQHRFTELIDAGYAGVFLDTLDSYQLVAKSNADREIARRQLVRLIQRLAQARPRAHIWLNRGFELLPEVHACVDGVVAESLFRSYHAAEESYAQVSKADRQWLQAELNKARDTYQLPVVALDYVHPANRELARETARQIADLGFIPYVGDGALATAGVGTVEIVPRRVLLLSGDQSSDAGQPPAGYRTLAPILEYLGLVTTHLPLSGPLPQRALSGTFQGIVVLNDGSQPSPQFNAFIAQQTRAGVPIALLGEGPLDAAAAQALGLRLDPDFRSQGGPVSVAIRDSLVGFEAEPTLNRFALGQYAPAAPKTIHLALQDAQGRQRAVVAATAQGGVALSHFKAVRGLHGEQAWVVDPFRFLQEALRLPDLPRIDVTTENGLRIAMVVVRGLGAGSPSSLPERPKTARLIQRELLRGTGLLHTVDLTQTDGQPLPRVDISQARWLGQQPGAQVAAHPLAVGETMPTTERPLLAQVEPMAYPTPDGGLQIPLPIAPDLSYIADSPESYPYVKVQATLRLLESPRRLKPVALDYHAFSAASPGGLQALKNIYAQLEQNGLFPLFVDAYRKRVQYFQRGTLVRHADGSFELLHSQGPVTLRLDSPQSTITPGDAAIAVAENQRTDGPTYVTLTGTEHSGLRFSLTPRGRALPHVTRSNARLTHVQRAANTSGVQLNLAVQGEVPLHIAFAALSAGSECQLILGNQRQQARVDADGTVVFDFNQRVSGHGQLSCHDSAGEPL